MTIPAKASVHGTPGCLRRAAIRPIKQARTTSPIRLVRQIELAPSHGDRIPQFPADGRVTLAADTVLVAACTWICAGRFGLTVTVGAGDSVHAGPTGLLEQAKLIEPLNDPTEMIEIGGAAVGGKIAVVPGGTVSTM